ncbi:DEAD/DEAH box helicase [Agromyces sp. Leaf222]|uniref:DEAD/DEAH box helicase n=1 Tax=Agromyces sp. Leaf222 TaxID=1735688 RepID=UPI0006F22044|nr:DEAD/DEAH box helicase [Agromyces sp. Leaf222]KQM81290.1 hypothetical protein ASE68_16010 [Agromyces sp. Leaf222]
MAFVTAQQTTAIETYRLNPRLLDEHVGAEDSYREGGYGRRQIAELLQNAADALTEAGMRGRVELRIADGSLYCANEGSPFNEKGITALCYAFISEKRDEESIGRFGLGFKSMLAITDHPQIFSSSVAFAFNAPEIPRLFEGLKSRSGRLPLLRVPSLLDSAVAMNEDPHLADLATWATTVVKLPLAREAERIHAELAGFRTRSLLFMKSVDRLDILLQGPDGTLKSTCHQRAAQQTGNVVLTDPDGVESRWLFGEREYSPSPVLQRELPATISRNRMTVSYAVRPDGGNEIGELWSWFPLQDRTTARGIFNAPWHISDDRTTLVSESELNRELLGICADLFLEVAPRAATTEDPAAHLDLFPARGREVRSDADAELSIRIPALGRSRAIIPDRTGKLRRPDWFDGVPILNVPVVPVDVVDKWLGVIDRETFPHPNCFSTSRDRFTRFRALLRTDDRFPARGEIAVSEWLVELATADDDDALAVALDLYLTLAERGFTPGLIDGAAIVPTEGGDWISPSSAPLGALIPVPDAPSAPGITYVARWAAERPGTRKLLHLVGFRDVSTDEIAVAVGASVQASWSFEEWARFWSALRDATPQIAAETLASVRSRDISIRILTRAGTLSESREVFADNTFAPSVAHRHADVGLQDRVDLLIASGCLTGPRSDFPVHEEPVFDIYAQEIRADVLRKLEKRGIRARHVPRMELTGIGPLSIFVELEAEIAELVVWTRAVLEKLEVHEMTLEVPVGDGTRHAEVPIRRPDWWIAQRLGLVITSLGATRTADAVGSDLVEYAAFLPVAAKSDDVKLGGPSNLAKIPDRVIEAFLGRHGYVVPNVSRLTEVVVTAAARSRFSGVPMIPAATRGQVVLAPAADVVLAVSSDDQIVLDEHGVPYLDGTVERASALVRVWGLQTSDVALARAVVVRDESEPDVLTDRFPSLQQRAQLGKAVFRVRSSPEILRRVTTPTGEVEQRMSSVRLDDVIVVDDTLDDSGVLEQVSLRLGLRLTKDDIDWILSTDETLRRNELVEQSRAAATDVDRLHLLIGVDALRSNLPNGLLAAVEAKQGQLDDRAVADLFLRVRGLDSIWWLKDELRTRGLNVPREWEGSKQAQAFVRSLGFASEFAGQRTRSRPASQQVSGRVELSPLHDYQEDLATRIRDLVLTDDQALKRALLFLPTGAGKTRVTVEAVIRMLVENELRGPILWIAQSEELCEQAIQTWTDVWRALGDKRPLDVSRFWGRYDVEESAFELQVVVAVDDKIAARIGSHYASDYAWLADASLVIIDEAHTALTKTYTKILRWLEITPTKTPRPLLGLTATPYRGRNADTNSRFAERFGRNKLESLDPDDPIGQLRHEKILAEVDHYVLDGSTLTPTGTDRTEFHRMREVTKSMLDKIGHDLERTQRVVDDVLRQDPNWQIIVFAASVSSAHTIAALVRLENRSAAAVDGSMRPQERRRIIDAFKANEIRVLVNCDLLTQGFDAPDIRALYIARPTFSPNRYHQMIGRGLRGPRNGGDERCLIVNVADTFEEFGERLAYNEFDYLWKPESGAE